VEGSCEHSNEPYGSIKCLFLSSCTTGGFSKRGQLREVKLLSFSLISVAM
jgi:hypothetical protein